jgi:hypothetical protein
MPRKIVIFYLSVGTVFLAGVVGGSLVTRNISDEEQASDVDLQVSNTAKKPGFRKGETRKGRGEGRMSSDLNEKEKSTLKKWYMKDYSITGAAKVGAICLKHRLSKTIVIELLGMPRGGVGANEIYYAFAPSQYLRIKFDFIGLAIKAEVSGSEVKLDGNSGKIWRR